MGESQKVEQDWETPSLEEIPVISRGHVAYMESTDDPSAWTQGGMTHVVLRTIGRRSGKEYKVALPTWNDERGDRIVVASYAGATNHPDWFHNLADREANPEVLCRVAGHAFWSVPEVLDGEDYDRTWAALTADRAWYNDYQAKTQRRIPLVRLPETRPA
jgi:deazaflavin-dependent oxidoreductase (nitroreductase family)